METNEDKLYNQSPWSDRRSREERSPYDIRSEYERDRGRLIHAPCFRRLQAKTQVLDVVEGDYHRTRLTHTMEVAQIARGIVQRLRFDNRKGDRAHLVYNEALPDYNLIEVIAFAHDLGHPPFGHNGEVALNYMMRNSGGFEGNAQSLRLVTRLENRYEKGRTGKIGLNLTRRVLLGILKYPRPYAEAVKRKLPPIPPDPRRLNQHDWEPPKCYYDAELNITTWLREPFGSDWDTFISWKQKPSKSKSGKTKYKSLDCSIMELADDIAYVTHDLEDGVALGFIKPGDWDYAFSDHLPKAEREEAAKAHEGWNTWRGSTNGAGTPALSEIKALLFGTSGTARRYAISHLVGSMMHSVYLDHNNAFSTELLAWNAVLPDGMRCLKSRLQSLAWTKVVESAELQTLEYRGRLMIMHMFEAIRSEPAYLLPTKQRQWIVNASEREIDRVVCDFIAGMTDPYATRYYDRLFTPRTASAFDKL